MVPSARRELERGAAHRQRPARGDGVRRRRDERLQLNEDTVWAGEKRDRINPAAAGAVPKSGGCSSRGSAVEAEALADKALIAVPRRMPPYQPLGDLTLRFAGLRRPTNYERELNLDDAIARVQFPPAAPYSHARSSPPPSTRPSSSASRRSGRKDRLHREAFARARRDVRAEGPDRMVLEGQAIADRSTRHADEPKTGVRFAATLRVVPEGGRVRAEGDALIVEGADAVTLLRHGGDELRAERSAAAACERALAAAPAKPLLAFARARRRPPQLFRRATLDSGSRAEAPDPADRRAPGPGARRRADPQLAALYFQFGRYLLIASSRPGTMAGQPPGHLERLARARPGTASTRSTSTRR